MLGGVTGTTQNMGLYTRDKLIAEILHIGVLSIKICKYHLHWLQRDFLIAQEIREYEQLDLKGDWTVCIASYLAPDQRDKATEASYLA